MDTVSSKLPSPFRDFAQTIRHDMDDVWVLTARAHGTNLTHHRVRRFTAEEIDRRYLGVGTVCTVWLAVLGVLSLLSVSRRKHGTIKRAWQKTVSELWRRTNTLFEGCRSVLTFRYHRISMEDDDDDDPSRNWDLIRGEVSEEARQRDRERLEKMYEEAKRKYNGRIPEEEMIKFKSLIPEEKQTAVRESRKLFGGDLRVVEMTPEEKAQLTEVKMHEFVAKGGSDLDERLLNCCKWPVCLSLFFLYVGTCVSIPLYDSVEASCDQGFPWEAHVPFLIVFLLVKFWELTLFAFDPHITGEMSVVTFMFKFFSSVLGFLDGYTDVVAMVLTHACGSDLWYWMFGCYIFGVVIMQWLILGVLSWVLDSSGTCFFKLMHMDALSMACSMSESDKHALLVWRLMNVFRTVCEDVPQSVLQTLFVIYVKKNYLVIISIIVSVACSVQAVYFALKRAADASGTNWEQLKAIQGMEDALNRDNLDMFSRSSLDAETHGLEKDDLEAWWKKAGEKFNLPSYQMVCIMGAVATEDQTKIAALERSAVGHEPYYTRRRPDNFGTEAAQARRRALRALETKESSAYKRGVLHEARYIQTDFDQRRRTVEWAIKQSRDRESRIQKMIVDAPGYCVGSVPGPKKKSNDVSGEVQNVWMSNI